MDWTRILAPLTGAPSDAATLNAAAALAAPFRARVSGVFAPADAAELMPWMGEGFLGGVQTTALESLKEAARAGEKAARRNTPTSSAPEAVSSAAAGDEAAPAERGGGGIELGRAPHDENKIRYGRGCQQGS